MVSWPHGVGVVAILAVIAAVDDLLYGQSHERQKRLLREIRDEFKESEGDPKIKAKIRQLRAMRRCKRMMAAVPTGPDSLRGSAAVGTRHERAGLRRQGPGRDRASRCARSRPSTLCRSSRTRRTLHATVQNDEEIPTEHYKAVAEVITCVMRLNGPRRWK